VNDCNERIVRHGLSVIHSSAPDDHDDSSDGGAGVIAADQQVGAATTQANQGSLLIDATCVPADIRHPTDLSLLNEARELTETLIDAMILQVRESFGHKPRTHRKQARQQFLAVAKKKRSRINKIRKAIKQQLGHLKRNLASIDAMTSCAASLLVAGCYAYQKLLVVNELVRQQNILYHSDSRSIPDSIVSLYQSQIRPIVRGKARCNVEFGPKISISDTGEGFTFLDRLSFNPYNEGEDLKGQARAYRRQRSRGNRGCCAWPG